MNKKKMSVFFMTLGLLVLSIQTSVTAGSGQNNSVAVHSQEEIREYIRSNGSYLNQTVSYAETPSTTSPYSAGKLTTDTYDKALAMVKNIRYIAGLSTDIEYDDTYNERAQAASLVNAVNGKLSHTPAQPTGMDDALYNLGYTGASSSNLAWGDKTLNSAILTGWMNDSDSSNIDCLGHRRWVLNSAMKKTGFGCVNKYSAMHVIGGSVSTSNVTVMWPARQMPIEYFYGGVWSVSTGNEENLTDIYVKLTRLSDNRTWNFSQSGNTSSDASGYFNVNNDGYGSKGCIIFKPNNIEYHAGDIYNVSISGASSGTIEYSTEFFPLHPVEMITIDNTTLSLKEGTQQTLTVTVSPQDATEKNITWESSDPTVASVDDNGELTAIKEGSADIIAKAVDGSGVTAKCEVTVTGRQLCGENAEYEFEPSNGKLRIFGTGKMYDYTNTMGDSPVPWKDILTDIKSVKIESGITYIGQNAFYNCNNLSTVTFSDSLQIIGDNAFGINKSLKEITFPDSIKIIGEGAFRECNIEELSIPAGVTVQHEAFCDNESLNKLIIGSDCILHSAGFGECKSLMFVTLREGSMFDDEGMNTSGPFRGCSKLKYLKLPNSWKLVDSDNNYVLQFKDCKALSNIVIDEDNLDYKVIDNVIYSKDGKKLIFYPQGLTAESYTIPSTTEELLKNAFYGQTYLKQIKIPDTIEKIDETAFEGVSGLQKETYSGNVWTGDTDTSWYKDNITSFNINKAEQLAGMIILLQQGKTFQNKRINLTDDILMNVEQGDTINEWILDGTESEFQGVLYGNGHSIYNMYVPEKCKGGLLCSIGENGVVKAVNMRQGIFAYGGAFANENHGEISFCHNYSDVSSKTLSYVGGICNSNKGYIYGCGNHGTVYCESASVGGIVGINTTNTACVVESRNRGEVTSYNVVSGIVGSNYAWIYDCYNRGLLHGSRSLYGIADNHGQTSQVINCYSVGNYDADIDELWFKDAISDDETVKNCYYTSSDIGSTYGKEITQNTLKQNSMITELNQNISIGFYSEAWQSDAMRLNDGFPVTTAEICEYKGQYKIKPEIWISSVDKSIDLYDSEAEVSFTHYFDRAEPDVYIENTGLAEVSCRAADNGDYVITIKPKTVGESNIFVSFDETDDTQAVIRKFTVTISHEHKLNHVPKKVATYSRAGNIEYWYCSKCGKYYSDADAVTEIGQAQTVKDKIEASSGQDSIEGNDSDDTNNPEEKHEPAMVQPIIEPTNSITDNDSNSGDRNDTFNKTNGTNTTNNTSNDINTNVTNNNISNASNTDITKNDTDISVVTDNFRDKTVSADDRTYFNIKNKKKYKISKKITIKDSDGIKDIKLNGKSMKFKKGRKTCSFKLSTFKKYLNKKNKWNKLSVTDCNGMTKMVKFKIK